MDKPDRVIRAENPPAEPRQYEIKNGRIFLYNDGMLQSMHLDSEEMRQWCKDRKFVNRYDK